LPLPVVSVTWLVVAGLVVGSFLTVVVERVPERRSVVRPGSACSNCGTRLAARDLVPVVSWLIARGRCRQCGAAIGAEPLVVELATAVVFVSFGFRFGWSWELPAFLVLGSALVALSAIDFRTKRLPRGITHTAALLAAPWLVAAALVADEPSRIVTALVGAVASFIAFFAIFVLARGGFGDGDVRLAPLLGLHLGWIRLGLVPLGLFLGFLLGAVVGVVMLVAGRAGRRSALPFGPFMAAGAVIAVLFGEPMVDMWLGT
jgi:leader peptidase (prepilin peptidase) / N-methyltransferase